MDERIARLFGRRNRTPADDERLEGLRRQQNALRGQLTAFQNEMERRYQAYAGKPSTLEEIQAALPADAALIGWLDVRTHRWACVVRHTGEPNWVQIDGTGQDGLWTVEDGSRTMNFRRAIARNQGDWRELASAVARQRMGPMLAHLKEINRLIVLPSTSLAGVPIEALTSALPEGAGRFVVSYAPSGSMLARLSRPREQKSTPPRLLALGDPTFPARADSCCRQCRQNTRGPARGQGSPQPNSRRILDAATRYRPRGPRHRRALPEGANHAAH